jgi:hypothetical protein
MWERMKGSSMMFWRCTCDAHNSTTVTTSPFLVAGLAGDGRRSSLPYLEDGLEVLDVIGLEGGDEVPHGHDLRVVLVRARFLHVGTGW